MRFRDTKLAGVTIVESEPQTDVRGSFERLWCSDEFGRKGLVGTFVQSSLSRNSKPFTVRGLHYQIPPSQEGKLVAVVAGRIFDVVVDLRENSPTLHQIVTVELDAARSNATLLYIPPQCAHGFQTLEPDTVILYCMTQAYDPRWSRTVHWRSPELAIPWPEVHDVVISDADAAASSR
ncbi:MAG: dTDP-4-dehydrorhamnose 3,5-epimerase family protein [Vulcanimicrobiaceae bacterium]